MAKDRANVANSENTNLLEDYKWDENESFFGIPAEESSQEVQEKVIRKVKDTSTPEEESNNNPPKKDKAKEGADGDEQQPEPGSESESEGKHSWFDIETPKGADQKPESKSTKPEGGSDTGGEGNAKTEVKKEGDEDAPSDDDVEFYTTLAKELKDKKIFSETLFKDEDEIDEAKFFELHDAEIEGRAEEIFEEFLEKIEADDDAKAFVVFKRNGGDTAKFFQAYKDGTGLPENLDLTKAADQKKVLVFYYTNVEELDADELDEKLEYVTEKGKTEENAKKYYDKIVQKQKQIRADVLKAQDDAKAAALDKSKKNKIALQEVLDGGKGVEGITFNDKDKKTLVDLATKPAIKIGTNRYITQMQALLGDVMKDPAKFLSLAKWLNEGMKFPELEKQVTTKVVTKTQKSLREARINRGLVDTGTNKGEKSLIDAFPD